MQARSLSNLSGFFELAKVLPEAVLLLSGGGEILAANPPAAAMLGLSARQLRGKSLYDLTTKPAEDVDHHLKLWSRTRALTPGSLSLKAANVQAIDCRCDGAVVQPPTEDSAAVIFLRCVPKAESNNRFLDLNKDLEALRHEHHRVSQINARLEERVEERTAQLVRFTEELRESEEWFRSLVKNTSDIVWVARADGTLSYVSPSVEWVLGYRPEDLIDTYGFDFIHPDDVARTQSFYDDVLERPDAIPSVEFRLRRSDGSWCHVESVGTNLLQDPSVSGVVFNSRDITERKQAEEETDLLRTIALEVGKAEDLDSALRIVLQRVCETTGWAIGQAWIPSDDRTVLVCSAAWFAEDENGSENLAEFRIANEEYKFEPGEGLPGYTWSRERPVWTRDITQSSFTRAPLAAEFGLKAAMDVPVLADSEVVAVLDFFVFEEREEDERLIEIVSGVAAQLGSVIRRKRAEEALRESEERNRAVVDTASDAIITMSEEGIVRSFNHSAERIFGYGSEEIVGQPLRVLMPERFRESHEVGFRRYLDTGEAHLMGKGFIELAGLRKSGEEFPLELSLGAMRTEDVSMLTGIIRDITERRRTQKALQASEERFRSLVAQAADALLVHDLEGRFVNVNQQACESLGYTQDELLNLSVTDVEENFNLEGLSRFWERIVAEGPLTIEGVHKRKDGTRFPVEVRVGPFETGENLLMLAVARDVTERKRAEEVLRESESRLLTAQRIASVGNWSFDVTANKAYWSDELYRIFGLSPQEEPAPTYKRFLSRVHPDDRAFVREASREALDGGSRTSIDYRAVRPDGEVRFAHSQYEVKYDASGRAVELIGTLQDITNRKRAEAALVESEERYRHLVELSPEAVIVHSEGKLVYANEATARLVGAASPEELVGKPIMEFAHPDYREIAVERIREAFATGEPIPLAEEKIVRLDGGVVDVEVTGVPIVYGGKLAIQLLARDIRERKQAAEVLRQSEERFRSLVQNASDVVVILEADGVTRYVSPPIEWVLGYKPEEVIGANGLDLIHPGDLERSLRLLAHVLSSPGAEVATELRLQHADGSWRYVEVVGKNLIDDPSIGGVVVNYHDVTDRRLAEDRLRQSEERFRSLVQNSSDVILIMGADNTVRYISPSVERVLGYEPEDVVGKDNLAPVHPDDMLRLQDSIAYAVSNPGVASSMELRLQHADGSWRHLESTCTSLLDDPAVGGIVINSRDITERKAFEQQLEHQAFHDDLTDLPNRTLFVDRLEHALASLERVEGDKAVAVLFVDLDNFKVINDSLGHTVGDHLLTAVAGRLRSCMRPEDTVARFGGDEFAVLLKDVKEVGDAVQVAERVSEELQTAFNLGGREVCVSPSIGISVGTTASDLAEDLLRNADTALYEAKAGGKARYAIFDSDMYVTVLKRLRMEGDLRRALERGEFRVYYQPKMKLSTDLQHSLRASGSRAIVAKKQETAEVPRIVGTEALIRWEHPDLGLVSPAEFIPVAEETGLIVQIGRWVLREACLQTLRWNDQLPDDRPLTVCVNLSVRQLRDPGLCEDVARILQETGLNPQYLCLEITESTLMEEAQRTIGTLQDLKGLGVQLAVDDFGTGYSSLSYLKRFPVDYLKIDRSFVEGLKKDAEDIMLVAGIIRLAHTLGMEVIAEGVESAEQLKRLQGLGCDLAQGFYFSKPLPAEAESGLLVSGQN